MEADYSVELGPSAPALELPWRDAAGHLHYLELRGAGGLDMCNLDRIGEAQRFPALRNFLADVNSPPSAWQTVKCDAWTDETVAEENLYRAGFTLSSYVDLVLAQPDAALRDCLEAHRKLANQMAQALDADENLESVAEIVVRRCYFHSGANLEDSDAGYCLTLFLVGYGTSPEKAAACWEHTLEFAAGCLLKLHAPEADAEKEELG